MYTIDYFNVKKKNNNNKIRLSNMSFQLTHIQGYAEDQIGPSEQIWLGSYKLNIRLCSIGFKFSTPMQKNFSDLYILFISNEGTVVVNQSRI